MGGISKKPPKGISLGRKTLYEINRQYDKDRSIGTTCARDEETKKKKDKEIKQWQTRYSPRPPTTSDRSDILHGRWSSGIIAL